MDQKDKPITSMSKEDREEAWDDVLAKEEGIIIEFDMNTKTGQVRSLEDEATYLIDSRELVKTRIELRSG